MTDAKGAQPEQLVERMLALLQSDDARFEIRNGEEVLLVYTDIDAASIALEALKAVDYSALATALSECREALRDARLYVEQDYHDAHDNGDIGRIEEILATIDRALNVSKADVMPCSSQGRSGDAESASETFAAQPPSEASERSGSQ